MIDIVFYTKNKRSHFHIANRNYTQTLCGKTINNKWAVQGDKEIEPTCSKCRKEYDKRNNL